MLSSNKHLIKRCNNFILTINQQLQGNSMKKMILSFILLGMISSYAQEGASTNIPDNNDSISHLIGTTYLQGRKKKVAADKYMYEKDTEEEKIFGTSVAGWADIYGVRIDIRKEGTQDNEVVIMETQVSGTPEDFENKNVLENEKKLLKFVLIKSYLDKLQEVRNTGSDNPAVVQIDDHTKSVLSPEHFVFVNKGMFNETVTPDKNHKYMRFVTIFSMNDFKSLAKPYFNI